MCIFVKDDDIADCVEQGLSGAFVKLFVLGVGTPGGLFLGVWFVGWVGVHFGPWSLRSLVTSVLRPNWTYSSDLGHFGPWSLRLGLPTVPEWPEQSRN